MLYILENGEQAYIGQSNHVLTRMSEHASSKQKKMFRTAHFIYSSTFNQSVTLDYEAKLIQYFVADNVFTITNGNGGIADKNYYDKKTYDTDFYKLWSKLRKEKLARKSIEELENTDLFKFSPFKALNDDQREAVEKTIKRISMADRQTIVVSGMPGSGKTIVAIHILKYLKDLEEYRDKTIGFVVPQTSLRKTLKETFKSIYNLKASDILSPSDVTKKRYDILIVDEAHRLHQYKNISYMGAFKKNCAKIGLTTEADELDWILNQCECAVLFYDEDQVVGPSGIGKDRFDHKFDGKRNSRLISYYQLISQMRVRGGVDYIEFVKKILCGEANEKKTFHNYEFKIISDFATFNEKCKALDEQYGLTRMVAGYAWEWASKNDKSKTDIVIEGIDKQWNYITENWVLSNGAVDQVGCIHSIQGYDLNYAFVIMGNDISYDPKQEEIIIQPKNYFDENGKKTASYEELKLYIINIYYVLMTRGIRGTYLYICDDNLRKYVASVVETE